MAQTVFERYEVKFIISKEQKENIVRALSEHMALDKYGRSLISNLYFDTDDFLLIRRSIEKPKYKEKLRVRTYNGDVSNVFVEMKKKHAGVVYKRRLILDEKTAMSWLTGGGKCPDSQIAREIDYSLNFYQNLKPRVFLAYDREAYYSLNKSDFRLTFDENIIFRTTDLSLSSPVCGERILDEDKVLMEVKCSGAIPLWLTKILSENKIYKTSFSKYGTVYTQKILKENSHATVF